MTGYGEAFRREGSVAVTAELRTVNGRYFKLSLRCPEGYNSLETLIEGLVRKHIKRGNVTAWLRVEREPTEDDYKINDTVLAAYRRQIIAVYDKLHLSEKVNLESLLPLPGVVDERSARNVHAHEDWPLIEQTLADALAQLEKMRVEEGRAMADDLKANCRIVTDQLDKVDQRAPLVAESYRDRLTERLNKLLAEFEVSLDPTDVVREVGMFAEKSDISEEVVRLRSHLDQFAAFMDHKESAGRKLEFLIQEMFREANTIGSKANDAQISRDVIEVKAAIERMREMIQNVQ